MRQLVQHLTFFIVGLAIAGCSSKNDPTPPLPDLSKYHIAGRAPYGLQHSNYNCDALISSVNHMPSFKYGWLYNTFDNVGNGEYLLCVYKLNALPQTKAMLVHLINEVCQRHRRCGEYEVLHGMSVDQYVQKLRARDAQLVGKLNHYMMIAAARILPTLREDQQCFISYGLESNLPQDAYQVLMSIGAPHFGSRCQIVWNPVGNNKYGASPIAGTVFEKHHSHPNLSAPCIANLDGMDIDLNIRKSFYGEKIHESHLPDFVSRYQHCEMVLLWLAEDNGISPGNFIDPRNRFNFPNQGVQDALKPYLIFEKDAPVTPAPIPPVPPSTEPPVHTPGTPADGPIASVCSSLKLFQKGVLWKPESQDTNDNREGKPLILFTKHVPPKKHLRIFATNGEQVGALGYFGHYQGSGARHYSGCCGGTNDTAESLRNKAASVSGGDVRVFVEYGDGVCYGPNDPTKRAGSV